MDLVEQIAEAFALGDPCGVLVPAALGWGGHNEVLRLDTVTGSWAIKQLGRRPSLDSQAAFAIEMAAFEGGIPMAVPIPTTAGRCWAEIGCVLFRCHGWIDGSAKENEGTSSPEARAMGRLVAQLHRLAIPCSPATDGGRAMDAERWMSLAHAGHVRNAGWARTIAEQAESLVRIAAGPTLAELGGNELVGSHRDLNAHNVLFSNDGLHLVDWDGAGPTWPRWERVDFALRWAERAGGRIDGDVLEAFVLGYLDGGGIFARDDPAVVAAAPAALAPWVVENLEIAIEKPTNEQDVLAGYLVDALLAMPETVTRRQPALLRCLSHLGIG